MAYSDRSFDGSSYVKLEGLFLWDSLVSTDGKVLGSDEVIKLGSSDGNVLGTILGDVYGIIFGIDVGTYMGSLDESFDGYNDGILWGLFLE